MLINIEIIIRKLKCKAIYHLNVIALHAYAKGLRTSGNITSVAVRYVRIKTISSSL
ncbi:hypothetical protein B2_gp61 [Shigella phage B2]|nr:hypothetical protein B2_gp61 [Shigella phage B2]